MNPKDTVTISEFIRAPKTFLDTASKEHKPVYIRRGLEIYKLQALQATFTIDEAFVGPNDPREEIVQSPPPRVFEPRTVVEEPTVVLTGTSDDGLGALNNVPEMPCCTDRRPCKHWAFDNISQSWKNTISGRVKEAAN